MMSVYKMFGKRFLDVMLVGLSTPIWLPILALACLGVWVRMGSPVFFVQERPGLHGKIFKLFKLRTMSVGMASDADRLTSLGRFLRSTSLDELPSLLNVLRGDMSLVGPRPLLVQYLSKYTTTQMRRHDVRPGITGLAQVTGRQQLLFSQRLQFDINYVEQISFWLDFKILCWTVVRVLGRKNIVLGQDVRDVDDLGLFDVQS